MPRNSTTPDVYFWDRLSARGWSHLCSSGRGRATFDLHSARRYQRERAFRVAARHAPGNTYLRGSTRDLVSEES